MEMFLAKLLESGRFYGLALLDPDMTPPPPSPPAQTKKLLPPQFQQSPLFQSISHSSPSQPIQQPSTPALSQQPLVHNIQPIFSTPSITPQNAVTVPASTSPRSAILKTINFNVQPQVPAAPIQLLQVQQPAFTPQTQQLAWPPPAQPLLRAPVQPPSFIPTQSPAPVYITSTKASTSMQATMKPASSTSLASCSSTPKSAAPGLAKFDVQSTTSDDSDDGLADAINKGFKENDSNSTISAPNAAASQQTTNAFEPQPSSFRPVRQIRACRPQSAFSSSFTATSSAAPTLPVTPSAQAPSMSAAPPQKDVSKIKLSMSIRCISEWASLSHKELSGSKKRTGTGQAIRTSGSTTARLTSLLTTMRPHAKTPSTLQPNSTVFRQGSSEHASSFVARHKQVICETELPTTLGFSRLSSEPYEQPGKRTRLAVRRQSFRLGQMRCFSSINIS
jgi:hypothetical protein